MHGALFTCTSGLWMSGPCGPSLPTAPQGWQGRVPEVGVCPAYSHPCSMPVSKADPQRSLGQGKGAMKGGPRSLGVFGGDRAPVGGVPDP